MRKLSIQEEAKLFQGKDRWHTNHFDDAGFSCVTMSDGPNGLRIEVDNTLGFADSRPATAFPTASLIGCSFDRALLKEYGNVLAEECMQEGVDVILGPGVNHKRSPLGGRNFEYLSEDPILSGELSASYINGVQEKGIGTSLKHFATNSREFGRMVYDSLIDERTLHEIYLKQFMIAIQKSHPWTIMNAYNKLNGIHCTQHEQLMKEARSWGFDGVFVSDWGAVYDPVASIKAGLNLEMPGGNIGADQLIVDAIDDETESEDVLHESTSYLKKLVKRCGKYEKKKYDKQKHHDFIKRCAEESIVLLKNQNAVLPLKKEEKVLVVGPFAKYPRFTGAGSSKVNSNLMDNIYTSMKKLSAHISYCDGFDLETSATNSQLIEQAAYLAKDADKVVIVCGLPEGNESEGYDRPSLSLPKNQLDCIASLCELHAHVVVVLQTGSPVLLPFNEKIEGLVVTYLAGAKGGEATANILYGLVNPSGKLAETWPLNEEDVPAFSWFLNDRYQTQYRETIYTGYRYYDSFHIPVSYSFGYGLSYTEFQYGKAETKAKDGYLETTLSIKNIGNRDGKEIVEVYMALPDSSIARCDHELINFEKVFLKAGEEKTITILTDINCLKYYDVQKKDWCLQKGDYEIFAGPSLKDLTCGNTVHLAGVECPYSSIQKKMYSLRNGKLFLSKEDFEKILGHSFDEVHESLPFTPDSTIKELQEKKLGKVIYKIAEKIANSGFAKQVDQSMIDETVIRQLTWLDGMSWKTVELGVSFMNKHKFSTLKQLIQSIQKNREK